MWRIFTATALAAVLIMACSCTYEPGAPWGYLDAELGFEPIRDSGDVEILDQSIRLDEMQLRAPAQSADAVPDFDPSDPPPGFTLCHQDHCHHEDGYTVSYDDIEAGIGIDSDGPINVARRTLNAELDLSAAPRHNVAFRLVDQVSLNETALTIAEISLQAELDDGDETYAMEITLAMATQPLNTGISYTVDRGSPERQDAEFSIQWPADLFVDLDHLDNAIAGAHDGTIVVHGTRNLELRDELIGRIRDETDFLWIEDYGEES